MTAIQASVVLIADNNYPLVDTVANHLEEDFPKLRILSVQDSDIESLDEVKTTCLFISIVSSKMAKWTAPKANNNAPLLTSIAFSEQTLDPVTAMTNGYTDVVSEGNLELLTLIINRQLKRLSHIRELSNNAGLSNSDFTGVHSRLEFLENVGLLAKQQTQSLSAILYLQLDNFTWINENLGMAAGDRFLKDIGQSLNSIMNEGDFAARFQGGNFILFICADDKKHLSSKADMVRETVHELTAEYENNILSSTASIGMRVFTTEVPLSELIENAYDASDLAKSNGGDTVHNYRKDSDDSMAALSKKTWNERIKQAFDNDLFVLYFQPIVSLLSDSSPRYEILLRMQDDKHEIISPGTFLPYAERAGLMADIDRKVINQSLTTAISHRDQTGEEPELFIKLSGKSVDDMTMASWVSNTLKELSYPAEKIVFEITESIALHHLIQTRTLCNKLQELGVKVALDHFGTRFRSFKLLADLKIDYLKIDGSIIQHLAGNKGHQAIVKRIVKKTQKQQILLVAESVQEASSLPLIWQYDIPLVQGFFLGVPTEQMAYDFRNLLI